MNNIYGSYWNKKFTDIWSKEEDFEQDIKDGKPLDLKKYQNHEIHDYGNLFSNAGNFIGNRLDYVMLNGIDEGIKVLKKLFSN